MIEPTHLNPLRSIDPSARAAASHRTPGHTPFGDVLANEFAARGGNAIRAHVPGPSGKGTVAAPLPPPVVNAPAVPVRSTNPFAPALGSTSPAAVLNTPAQAPAPTAESVFGSNPWHADATGFAPDGTSFPYNPLYFATPETAAKVAAMVGGKVVEQNAMAPGGGFQQLYPNQMVELPNGHLINAGLVASFYTHGYPQNVVDQMVANEVKLS
jgi:hypothetical protein